MVKKKKLDCTEDWALFEKGREYNHSIDLYSTVNRNERFYRGDQWQGVESGGLPKPVFNIFKRIIGYYISNVMQSRTTMRFSYASPFGNNGGTPKEDAEAIADCLNKIIQARADKAKLNDLLSDALMDAALSGDAIAYTYWEPSVKTGQAFTGDFKTVLVDNTNVFFGNPNSKNVQSQPYILISSRETVASLVKHAKNNGVPEEMIKKIVPDDETSWQSGDLAAKELEGTKCTALIKLWKDENGKVCYRKSVKNAVICPDTATPLTMYPIAFMNWTPVKNSWHGVSAATGLIENQVFINKGFAMAMKHMMDTAFSKVIYDSTIIDNWTNKVGEAIAVNGSVESVAKVLPAGQMQSGMLDVLGLAISHTKEFMGATDTALGDVDPTNTSAIMALQQASALPLENIRRSLYAFAEEIGLIWLDFVFAYYDDLRLIETGDEGYEALPLSRYKHCLFNCRVEAGSAGYWSEIATLNTLNTLLQSGNITMAQYLERIPEKLIPKKDELLEEIKSTKSETATEEGEL
ncbi:MAG: hypothetical protein IJC49_00640 [Clostridia bacterium]|nr:hypothetical protein [Clostridia bacterium]